MYTGDGVKRQLIQNIVTLHIKLKRIADPTPIHDPRFWGLSAHGHVAYQGALAIRRIFSLVDMITKPKFSNCPNVFKIGLFR